MNSVALPFPFKLFLRSACFGLARVLRYVFAVAAFSVLAGAMQVGDADVLHGVTLTPGTWSDVEAIVQKNKGKIVVVDIWSTSCLPCMTEFPNLVKLQKTSPENLVCVSFNVDYVGIKSRPPEAYKERVEKFLRKNAATFHNVLCTTESDDLFAQLTLSSIPAVYVFGREGELVKRFDDSLLTDGKEEAFTYQADINPLVHMLLSE